MILRAVLLLLCLLAAAGGARAGDPPQTPFLRIEAGAHIGAIPRMAISADGKLLATASFDKTLRLWSLPDGEPRGVLRPPIGSGEEGELYAVALMPDGSRAFAAGTTGATWDGTFSIYLFDIARATFAGQLGGLPAPVSDLAVSPDGARLAAGLLQGGVRVWDAHNGKPVFEDRDYGGPVRTVVFDRAGRLFTAAADGKLRTYDPAGHRTATAAPPSGLPPWGLAVSPDGFLLAVAAESADKSGKLHLDVVNSRTLAPVFAPDTTGLSGEGLLAVSWAGDGRGGVQLLAGGYAHGANGYVLRRWPDFGLGPPTDIAAAHDTIRHILPLPQGGAVFAAEDPGWGVIGPDGTVTRAPAAPMADLRPARKDGLAVSDDGSIVEFATASGMQRFSLADRTLGPDNAAPPAKKREAPGLSVTGWQDSNAPKLNNVRLPLERNEFARDVAVLSDGSAALLATDTHLRLFGRDGHEIASVETPAEAWAVAVAPNASVAVAALLDGSVRWYGLGPSEHLAERAALFAHADGQRWVLFTPEGLFDDADQGGNDLVGVHLNRARNQAPEWLSLSQAFRIMHAPGEVRARVTGDAGPAKARLAEFGDLRPRLEHQPQVALQGACVPDAATGCTPLAVQRGSTDLLPAAAARVRVTAKLADRGLGIGPVDVFVNGRNVGRQSPDAGQDTVAADVPLDPGTNVIRLRAYDATGAIFAESPPLRLLRDVPQGEAPTGKLYVLAIGIDRYGAPELTLRYAVADATRFAEDVKRVAAPIFGPPDVTLLTTPEQTTKAAILAALDRLAKVIKPEDTFLFYIASHGALDPETNTFMLVPADMKDLSSWPVMERQAIGETTFVSALAKIQARDALLFIDTCHSGKVTADSLANVGHETGRYLLAASGSAQEALDSFDGRNGVFVYALSEAFDGKAGQDANGDLGALALGEYVERRVSQLARLKHHSQDAVFRAAQRELRSFLIARVIR
jgi:hypothetical protein